MKTCIVRLGARDGERCGKPAVDYEVIGAVKLAVCQDHYFEGRDHVPFAEDRGLRRVVFRVRRVYFDAIVSGAKTREVRKASEHWLGLAARLRDDDAGPIGTAVFVCGEDIHRREILGVTLYETAEEALGRPPSEQGLRDVGAGPVLGFDLGAVV